MSVSNAEASLSSPFEDDTGVDMDTPKKRYGLIYINA